MKKLFIGLLIVAAGTGVYFFLRHQNKKDTIVFNKDAILGHWKLDSVAHTGHSDGSLQLLTDSTLKRFSYEFKKDSTLMILADDSDIHEYPYYEWTKDNKLLLKDDLTDTTGELFTIYWLQKDSLVMQSADSVRYFFVK